MTQEQTSHYLEHTKTETSSYRKGQTPKRIVEDYINNCSEEEAARIKDAAVARQLLLREEYKTNNAHKYVGKFFRKDNTYICVVRAEIGRLLTNGSGCDYVYLTGVGSHNSPCGLNISDNVVMYATSKELTEISKEEFEFQMNCVLSAVIEKGKSMLKENNNEI